MAGDHLADEHALQLVLRLGADHGGGGGQVLAVALLVVGVGDPKAFEGLVGEDLVEVVAVRTAQLLELGLCIGRGSLTSTVRDGGLSLT